MKRNTLQKNIWAGAADALAEAESALTDFSPLASSYWEDYCEEKADEKLAPRFDPLTGLLLLPVQGMLMRGAMAELELYCGYYDTRRIDDAAAIAAAPGGYNGSVVKGFALLWDSPGGYVSGWKATLSALAAIRATRPDLPIVSLVAGTCASLAYTFAAAAGPVVALAGSVIGSIGVMSTTTDSSQAFLAAGMERRLFADGKYKGLGTPGIPWSEDWYQSVANDVAAISSTLKTTIATARPGISPADMQGQTWEIEDAPTALHDGITDLCAEEWLEAFATSLAA